MMFKRILIAMLAIAPVIWAETLEEAVDRYLEAADPAPEQQWTVTGAFGVTVTDGNSDTVTVNAGIEASRPWGPWALYLKFTSLYAESEGVQTASEHIFTERLERQLDERSWLFQEFMLENDEQEDLSFRLQFTLGYKRQLVKKEKLELFGEIGGGVLHEEFRTDPETEGILQIGFFFKWQITEQLLFTQTLTIYPSLSEGGEFRLVSESVFSTPIGKKLDLRLSIIDKFDSNAPAGVEENDLQVTLALSIKFTAPKK